MNGIRCKLASTTIACARTQTASELNSAQISEPGSLTRSGSMSQQANVDLIQSFEDRFIEGDIDYVMSILTDDVTVHECANVPYPGDHRGKEAFLKLAQAFGEAWDIQSPLELEILPAGDDKVLVQVGIDALARATGTPINLRIAEVYTIRDGKIADIVVYYWDNVEMAAATGGAVLLQGEPA